MMSEQGVNGSSKKTNEKQSRVVEYISKLGLDEADLAKISKLEKQLKETGVLDKEYKSG